MTPFEAAEIAMDKALASEEVASAKRLEKILGGNGQWTTHRAFEVWRSEMISLGFEDTAGPPDDDWG